MGLNCSDYQLERAREHTRKAGLQDLCTYVKVSVCVSVCREREKEREREREREREMHACSMWVYYTIIIMCSISDHLGCTSLTGRFLSHGV